MKSRVVPLASVAVLFLALALAGCADTSASGDKGDGTISYGITLPAATLDPARVTTPQELIYLMPVYDRLVEVDPLTGKLEPMLATKWTVDEKGGAGFVDFTLRSDLTFPDGTPLDASAVVANIKRSKAAEGSGVAADLSQVTGAKALDDLTVRISTKGPAAWLPGIMGGRAGMMISPSALDSPNLPTKPAGIGMWTLHRMDATEVSYTATKGYWDAQEQKSKRLEIRYLSDDNARFNALRTGELDTSFIRASQVDEAKDAGLETQVVKSSSAFAFHLNTSRSGLDDPRVRQALQYAVDRSAISDLVFDGYCDPNEQLFGVSTPQHSSTELYPHDPKRARKLLTEAGAQSLKLVIGTVDIDQYRTMAEVVQSQLGEAGIKASVRVLPSGSLRDTFAVKQETDLSFAPSGTEMDPSQVYSTYFAPTAPYNPGGWKSPEVGELATDALGIADPDKRNKAYQEMGEAAAGQATSLAICSPRLIYANTAGVKGFKGARVAAFTEFRGVSG